MIYEFKSDVLRNNFSQKNPPGRRLDDFAANTNVDHCVNMHFPGVVGDSDFFGARKLQSLSSASRHVTAHIIEAQNDVLSWPDDRSTCRGTQNVIRGHHEHTRFDLCLDRKRNMNCHLVTVKVCVERRTDKWVQLNGLALDQHRLKSLHAKPMKSWRTIQ